MSEIHVVVLWEFARAKEREIVDEISRSLDVVATMDLSWPTDPVEGFKRFYGAKLLTAQGKVESCGGGQFRLAVVRDRNPQYGMRETSRGIERVNTNMFDLKDRCRAITGGGHKVHATNSPEEARRDIYLLTGHTIEEWGAGSVPQDASPLPGLGGWRTLRDVFAALDETTTYAVIRNFEMLPDGFDSSLHGDIDLLVPDATEVAGVLGARKVFSQPWRVHYEIMVAERPVRLDLRFVGDDYYCEEWERHILENRRRTNDGVWIPSAQDAFFALVYHALFQKYAVAPDYHGKAAALAEAAGIGGGTFDEWLVALRAFLSDRGYAVTRARDKTVKYNRPFAEGETLARSLERMFGVKISSQRGAGSGYGNFTLPTAVFEGEFDGCPCFVKYALAGWTTIRNEWLMASRVSRLIPDNCVRPLFWHQDGHGGACAVTAKVAGRSFQDILDSGEAISPEKAGRMAADFLLISNALAKAGVVHRDLRPRNFMVSDEGRVTVLDFQLAIDKDAKTESAFLAARHFELLGHLGGDTAVAYGVWDDRAAMLRCVEKLPPCTARTAAIDEIGRHVGDCVRVSALPKAMKLELVKQRWKLRIKRRMGWLFGKALSSKEKCLEKHIARVLTGWRFA